MPAIGKMPCLACGEQLTVKANDKGALNVSCPECDLSAYAKEGTAAKRALMPRIKLKDQPAPPKPDPKPAPKADPKPAPKPEKMPWET